MTTLGEKNHRSKAPKLIMLMGVFVLVSLALALGIETVRADGRILPNVSIGTIAVGGLTPAQAEARIREALRAVNSAGFNFSFGAKTVTLRVDDTGTGPITYDIAGMVRDAFAYGHDGGGITLALATVRANLSNVMLTPKITVDRDALKSLLVSKFGGAETRRTDADIHARAIEVPPPTDGVDPNVSASGTVSVNAKSAENTYRYEIDVVPANDGSAFDYGGALDVAAGSAARWRGADISLTLTRESSAITTENAARMRDVAFAILQRGDLNLAYDDQKWPIAKPTLADALTLKTRPDGTPYVGLRSEIFENILGQINEKTGMAAEPTKFKLLESGKVDQESFVGGQVGKSLNRESTFALLEERMADPAVLDVPVIIDTSYAKDTDPLAETMGIRELLGYGTSNYSGSPGNRTKNIANGARLVGGSIVKPDEEFSLLATLRPFNIENGYLPELVIKEKRTVPEVGGGLCQIGTTTFRATMASGLPVTQRQNHSYRVVYYEPAGTDATIYDPAPDFRFSNDTGSNIVIITKVLPKSRLRFEFWGTRDGRVEKQSAVKLWNETKPPAAKLIETSELADGKQKCFETAHAGATTEFTYTITYPDGRVEKKVFRSVYKPWQQQCLIGKAGAPRIVLGKDGSIKELPAKPGEAVLTLSTGIEQPAGFN